MNGTANTTVFPRARRTHGQAQAWRRRRSKGQEQAAVQMFRYADDWILVIRGTKAQAQDIKEACKTFLWEELGLELSDEKTKITHIEEGFNF
jgi:RNA-directed DNA polymerase